MNKRILGLIAVCVSVIMFGMTSFAGSVEGTVKSVNAAKKSIEISKTEGSSMVMYTDATKWPAGTTDPASLVGSHVKVSTDDATEMAISVEKMK